MIEFLQRLRQRKLVQWTLAYLAAAFAVIQAVDVVADRFTWPVAVSRYLILAIALGLLVVIALAWYHGERTTRHVASAELLIIALLLVVGGVVIRYAGQEAFMPAASSPAVGTPEAVAAIAHDARAATQPAVAESPAGVPAKSIAVLPFENLSTDKNNAYFADGMQDLILSRLSDIGDLKVISRTSTLKYQARPDNLKQVAAELGVATLLEGSVQKHGNQVLINVRLIDAQTDAHLWAHTYRRTLDDIFGVEGEVATEIASALHAALSPRQSAQLAATPTTNQAAYDLFLRAEYQRNRSNVGGGYAGSKAAISLYQEAVAHDPKFALAYAQLSMVESDLAFNAGGADVARLDRQARTHAEQAVKLQPGLPAAYLALGYSEYWGRRNYAGALGAFGKAASLRPNDSETMAARGYVERRQGRFDDALASLTHAVALDPYHFQLLYELANTYMMVGRYAEAETWCRRALAIEPDSVTGQYLYAYAILYGSGDVARALAQVQGDNPELKFTRVRLLVYQRRFDQAVALLESIPDDSDVFSPGASKALRLAILHWQAGDIARARPLFAQALPGDRAALATAQGIDQAQLWDSIAVAEIGRGRTGAGLAAVARSEAILDRVQDAILGPRNRLFDAMAYAMAKRADLAVPLLERALSAPGSGYDYSPIMLWLDPSWDPIRGDARFDALLQRYARYKPTQPDA